MPRRFGQLGPRQAQQHVVVHAWSRAWIALVFQGVEAQCKNRELVLPPVPGRFGQLEALRHAWELQAAQSAAGSAACPGASASSRRGRPSSMSTRFGQLEARSPCGSASSRGCSLTSALKSFYQQARQAQQHAWACRPAQVLRAQPHAQQAQ